jgi:hypothetical protein
MATLISYLTPRCSTNLVLPLGPSSPCVTRKRVSGVVVGGYLEYRPANRRAMVALPTIANRFYFCTLGPYSTAVFSKGA